MLRAIGGEISEIFLLSGTTELTPASPCLLSGRFLTGGLFQATFLPNQRETRLRISLVTPTGRAVLQFASGWPGSAELTSTDEAGNPRRESWESLSPWQPLVERFERAVLEAAVKKPLPGQVAHESWTQSPPLLGWQDELRALELDEPARRSVERGRASTLDLQESTEEASFKGTMTLVGCSMIWLSVVVLIASAWVPWLLWGIVPVFGLFLALQVLRWVVPTKERGT